MKPISLKIMLSPYPIFSILGLILGITGVELPDFVVAAFNVGATGFFPFIPLIPLF
jgi:hypothetical protein